ncbi:MAG: hypothetical protein ACLFTG_09220 [Alphaproteobacteria bacterium]
MRQPRVAAAQLGPLAKEEAQAAVVARPSARSEQAARDGAERVVFTDRARTSVCPRDDIEDDQAVPGWFERAMPNAVIRPWFERAQVQQALVREPAPVGPAGGSAGPARRRHRACRFAKAGSGAAARLFHPKPSVNAAADRNAIWAVAVAEAGHSRIGGARLVVAAVDLHACRFAKTTVFDLARHRRVEHRGRIASFGPEPPVGARR